MLSGQVVIVHTDKRGAIVGTPKPLSFLGALTGPSAVGKSSAYGIAGELVPISPQLEVVPVGLGSAEGIAEALFEYVMETNP